MQNFEPSREISPFPQNFDVFVCNNFNDFSEIQVTKTSKKLFWPLCFSILNVKNSGAVHI